MNLVKVGEVDHGIVTAELIRHVVVGRPVVDPTLAIDEISEPVGPTRLDADAGDKALVISGHRVSCR